MGRLLAPDMPAAGAPAAAECDRQRRRLPTGRLVCQPPDHGVVREALAATAPAPLIRLDHTTCEQCAVGVESLAGDLKAELVETAEGGQIRAGRCRPRPTP